MTATPPPAADAPPTLAADRFRGHRGRFRSDQHRAAHGEAGNGSRKHERAKISDHPLVPDRPATLVADADALEVCCASLADAGAFAFDTEFIGENTYHPVLCLVQAATAEEIVLIDPIAVGDLTPFWRLVGDAAVRKVAHAADQDLEPAVRLAGVRPANVLDTQIAAAFCGLPYPSSLAKLVEYVTSQILGDEGVKLGKGLTFTQWDQRPLSKKQLAYAADDVRYLPLLADWIDGRLARDDDRRRWAQRACADECDVAPVGGDPAEAWRRVRGLGGLGGREQAVARRLAAWRDEAARAEDLPPRALVRDEVIVGLCRRPPADAASLADVKHLPRPVANKYGAAILAAVEAGRADAPVPVRRGGPEATLADKFEADAALSALQAICHSRGVDPAVVAPRRDVESLVRLARDGQLDGDDAATHPLLAGWRREAAGADLLALLTGRGEVTLAPRR